MNQNSWNLIRLGNKRAFTDFYNNYADLLYNYGMKITPNDELVHESIQMLFVNIYERRRTLSFPISMRAYLFSSLKRLLIRAENRNKKFMSLDYAENVSQDFKFEPNVETQLICKQYEEEFTYYIQSLLELLSPRQKDAIFLKYFNNHTNKEIADILDISPQAAKNLIYTAIYKMRKYKKAIPSHYLFLK